MRDLIVVVYCLRMSDTKPVLILDIRPVMSNYLLGAATHEGAIAESNVRRLVEAAYTAGVQVPLTSQPKEIRHHESRYRWRRDRRQTRSVEKRLSWLYLEGVSSGDFREALDALHGEQAQGYQPQP